jgi:ectoine hydroxylase-related dioxygenase (phytanoyl-CoA dioxygenase family)
VTIWTALDPATKENGCVQILPGTHRFGIINTQHDSGFLTEQQAEQALHEGEVVFCELEPGECMLLHNWLLHSSDKNHSQQSRRAFSVCYADARTKDIGSEKSSEPSGVMPVVFGKGALIPKAAVA